MADIKKIKLGETTYDIRDADAARVADAKISSSSATTVAVGGIAKGTNLKDKSVAEVIEQIFFPYVAFSFSSISTTASSGTKEYGTSVTISKVKPTFTAGSKAINSVKIGTTSGGSDLYLGTSATSGTNITLTTNKVFNGTNGGTIYCTLSDGTKTLEKTASVSYTYYTYYAVTDTPTAPTSWSLAKNSDGKAVGSGVEGIVIDANAGQYVWLASGNSNYTGICELNELSGKYNTASSIVKSSNQTLVNSQSYTCTNKYTFYRLEAPRTGSGESTFKLS